MQNYIRTWLQGQYLQAVSKVIGIKCIDVNINAVSNTQHCQLQCKYVMQEGSLTEEQDC